MASQLRHAANKKRAVEYKGGKCQVCGYNKSLAALSFHHRDPSKKDFNFNGRLANWDKNREELDKCDLLCANCHCEEHERLRAVGRSERYAEVQAGLLPKKEAKRSELACALCGKPFTSVGEAGPFTYCSKECADESRRKIVWPDDEALRKMLDEKPADTIRKELGASHKTLRDRCKRRGIETKPRGFWKRKKSEA